MVMASPRNALEAAYRKHKIFYYAIEPFSDNEIADILAAAFRVPEPPPAKFVRPHGPSEPISSISITNRNGQKVRLLAAPGLLWRNEGLGCLINQKLLEQMFPLVIAPGEANLTPASILEAAAGCDQLVVLLARDSGLLPGGLARDTKPDFGIDPGKAFGKIETMAVQPDAVGGLAGLDPWVTGMLANHIVREMATY